MSETYGAGLKTSTEGIPGTQCTSSLAGSVISGVPFLEIIVLSLPLVAMG